MIVTITNNAYFSLGSKTLGQMVGGYYSKDMMDISYCPSWKRHAFGLNGSQSLFTMFRRQARCDHCFEWKHGAKIEQKDNAFYENRTHI
jgi:hypothetical protein